MIIQASPHTQSLVLQVPRDVTLTVTPEQFAALAAANRELRLERTATGELIVNPPTGGETGRRNARIITQLGIWWSANESLGEYFDSSTGFELPNGANRSPDASWVRRQRWEALTSEQKKAFVPLCPDFVVELRSESDRLEVLQAKMQEYIDNGDQLGWLIDPKTQRVEVYRADQGVEVLDHPSALSAEDILPGFTLSLKQIFS